jgi:hypothetical protein
MHHYQQLESKISCQTLISCLSKIDNYTIGNIKEAHDILKRLIGEHASDSASLQSMRSILVTVKDKQLAQADNSKKVQEYVEYYTKNMADFDIDSWTTEKIKALVSLSDSDPTLFSHLSSKWTAISTTIEKEKKAMKELERVCHSLLGELQKLPNTSWTSEKNSPISELIRNRKAQMKELDKKCESLAPLFEHSINKIKAEEGSVKQILQSLDDLSEEAKIVENFYGSIQSFIEFHQTIQNEIKHFLHFRNQSCRLLYLCLDLDHNDCNEYVRTSQVARDPHLLTLIKSNDEHVTEKLAVSKDLTLERLVNLLHDSKILPLDDMLGREESFDNFWKSIHDRSKQTVAPQKPGMLERRELLEQVPINQQEDMFYDARNTLDIECGPRRPAHFLTKRASSYGEHPTVHFEEEASKKNPNIGGILTNIWKAKDAFMNMVGSKKEAPTPPPRKNSRNPFTMSDSRKTSYSSAYELSNMDHADEDESDAAIKRVMRENSRLRAEVLNIRQDLGKEKDHKLSELEKRLHQLERKTKPKSERKDSKSQRWILEQQHLMNSPNSSASNVEESSNSTKEPKNSKERLNRLTSIAAAVVAGIDAVEVMNRKSKKEGSKKNIVDTRMVLNTTDPKFSEVELKRERMNKYSREDSGIGRSNRASNDEMALRKGIWS